jgi:hypothetical protein
MKERARLRAFQNVCPLIFCQSFPQERVGSFSVVTAMQGFVTKVTEANSLSLLFAPSSSSRRNQMVSRHHAFSLTH